MRLIAFLLVAVAAVAGVVASTAPASGHADEEAAPIFVTKIPSGYRDWRLISVAHEEGNLNDFAPFWGTIWRSRPIGKGSFRSRTAQSLPGCLELRHASEENNKVFGQPQSFVAGTPKNGVQFMVKDSRNTPRPAAGGSLTSTTANLPTRLC